MSVPNPFRPVCGMLGAREPVPALAESIVVPARCNMAIPLYGLQEFIIEFTTNFPRNGLVVNIITGAIGVLSYGDHVFPGWITYRSFSNEPFIFSALSTKPYRLEARERSLSITYGMTKSTIDNLTGDLKNPDLTLAFFSPGYPERESNIPLIGDAFVVKKIDETLVHDFRFRADGNGFYDIVEGKNYYFTHENIR